MYLGITSNKGAFSTQAMYTCVRRTHETSRLGHHHRCTRQCTHRSLLSGLCASHVQPYRAPQMLGVIKCGWTSTACCYVGIALHVQVAVSSTANFTIHLGIDFHYLRAIDSMARPVQLSTSTLENLMVIECSDKESTTVKLHSLTSVSMCKLLPGK